MYRKRYNKCAPEYTASVQRVPSKQAKKEGPKTNPHLLWIKPTNKIHHRYRSPIYTIPCLKQITIIWNDIIMKRYAVSLSANVYCKLIRKGRSICKYYRTYRLFNSNMPIICPYISRENTFQESRTVIH